MHRTVKPRPASTIALAGFLACAFAMPAAGAFCEVVFKDVAEHAAFVALVEYRQEQGDRPHLHVIEFLKGRSDRESLKLGSMGLRALEPKQGDRFLLALTRHHTLVDEIRGAGLCLPVSVLPVRGGKLRARDRSAYDGGRGSMTLDELRADLGRDLPPTP